jgi:hypothetical protein
MEKVANKRDSPISPQMSNRKRTWSGSNRSEHDGGGGGHSGGSQAGSGSGKNNRMTERSRKWPEVRRNDGHRSRSESSHDGGYGYESFHYIVSFYYPSIFIVKKFFKCRSAL